MDRGVTTNILIITNFGGHQNNNIWSHHACVNDINSMKFLIKGVTGIFLDTQQHFRPDSLTAYVTIASQVIRHSLSHFKSK